ncbi:MAG: hypothetical protein M1832_001697 [Thelocarpon impressellum]|nr:MAG: hypothetical protein M1832_001697 [Thelocarpon impressellum]
MSAPKSIKTRLLILSDTHTAEPAPAREVRYAYRQPLPAADVLLHCGDLTMIGLPAEYAAMIAMLSAADAELKLVIAGNHDISLDRPYYDITGRRKHYGTYHDPDAMKAMWTCEEARKAGIVYLEEGVSSYTLRSGATFAIYASPYQPAFCNMAFAYPRGEDRFNPGPEAANPVPTHPGIDLMMTHGPPLHRLDRVVRNSDDVGCAHLLRAVERARPRVHCFGHIHEGWGAERVTWGEKQTEDEDGIVRVSRFEADKEAILARRAAYVDLSAEGGEELAFGRETLFVNAAVRDVRYEVTQAPWLIDLDLPVVP